MLSVGLSVGSVLNDRFELLAKAGEGGMGIVFRARDRHTGAIVALKVLSGSWIEREIAERFRREAKVLAELRHPGIVAYVAHGSTQDRRPFLAMEWIDGGDLEMRLRSRPLTLRESLTMTRRSAEALAVVHARGIVHRDLKPSNILLRGGDHERVALADFGLARHAIAHAAMTRTGAPIGTPGYMSPEQALGERELTTATDVFSLGCALYECLAGAPPFVAAHPGALLAKLLFDTAPPIRRVRASVPEAIEAMLVRVLARDPKDRPRDARAFLAELDAIDALPALPDGTPPPSRSRAAILVESEQQLACVVLAVPAGAATGHEPTLDLRATHGLEGLASGATATILGDGTVVVTITQELGETARDMAIRAARFALVLSARRPDDRFAVATGRGVVVRGHASGEVHDRAQRLLPAAETGVVIDELTAALIEARFLTARTPSGVRLEGERASPDDERPLRGRPTSCLGREQELTVLSTLIAGSFAEPAAGIALVTAGPGMGKSRLRQELLRRMAARGDSTTVLVGRGDPMTAGVSYGLVAPPLRRFLGVTDDAVDPATRRAQFEAGARALVSDPAAVAFLGELCALPFPAEGRPGLAAARENPLIMAERVTDAFVALVRASCRASAGAWLLVLEDLHWGDAMTVRLVDVASRALESEPFFVLALARPEVTDAFPRLWAERTVREIRLGSLPRRAAERLVEEALGERVSAADVERLAERAGGNPLFLEELVRAVAEGKAHEMPESVLAMMQVRLMGLEPGARQILRAASVFGETFWRGGVVALTGDPSGTVDSWLGALVAGEVVLARRESRFPGEVEYAFRHGLLRDAAYSALVDADLRAAHRAASAWLSARGEAPYVLAEHDRLAGDTESALPRYAAAAEQAFENADLVAALARCERALACGASGELLGRVSAVQAGSRLHSRDFAGALAAGRQALEQLPRGSAGWSRTMAWMLAAAGLLADAAQLFALVRELDGVEPDDDARAAHVQALSIVVTLFAVVGTHERAQPYLAKMARLAPGAGDSARAWYALAHGMVSRFHEGRLWDAYQEIQEARAIFERIGDRRQAVMHALTTSDVERELNDLAAAEAHARWALAEAERLGERQAHLMARIKVAGLRALAGQRDELEALARSSDFGDNRLYAAILQMTLGEARLAAGDLEGAEISLRRALAALTGPPLRIQALAPLARVLALAGRTEEAVAVAQEALALLSTLGHAGGHGPRVRFAVAEAFRAAGDAERAAVELRAAAKELRAVAAGLPAEARERYLAAPDHVALVRAEQRLAEAQPI